MLTFLWLRVLLCSADHELGLSILAYSGEHMEDFVYLGVESKPQKFTCEEVCIDEQTALMFFPHYTQKCKDTYILRILLVLFLRVNWNLI